MFENVEFPKKNVAKLFNVKRKSDGYYLRGGVGNGRTPQWVFEKSRATSGYDFKTVEGFIKVGLFKLEEIEIDTNITSGWV